MTAPPFNYKVSWQHKWSYSGLTGSPSQWVLLKSFLNQLLAIRQALQTVPMGVATHTLTHMHTKIQEHEILDTWSLFLECARTKWWHAYFLGCTQRKRYTQHLLRSFNCTLLWGSWSKQDPFINCLVITMIFFSSVWVCLLLQAHVCLGHSTRTLNPALPRTNTMRQSLSFCLYLLGKQIPTGHVSASHVHFTQFHVTMAVAQLHMRYSQNSTVPNNCVTTEMKIWFWNGV